MFGLAIFHEPDSASSSPLTAITTGYDKHFTRYDELDPEILWISNADRLQMAKAKLNVIGYLKHSAFTSVNIPQIAKEYMLSKEPIENMSLQNQRDIFDALNFVLNSVHELFPDADLQASSSVTDAVTACLGGHHTKMSKIVLMIMRSQFRVSQELPSPALSGSQRIVDLSFPRAVYNEHLLTLPLPNGDWKNVKRNDERFGHLFAASPDQVSDAIQDVSAHVCALVCIKLVEKQDNDALKALALNNVNASWLTLPEALAVSLRTSIKVTDAIVSDKVTTGAECLHIDERLTNYERLSQQVGLFLQEGLEALISKSLVGPHEQKYPSPEAVYLASYNRLLMSDALDAVHDRGVTVTRFGLNTITVAVEERDLEDILQLGYEQGLRLNDEQDNVSSAERLAEPSANNGLTHA